MSNGVLAFTIGMSTSPLLSAVQQAKSALASLITVGATAGGVMDAIGRGAALQQLHWRTGETVQDLFLMQRGFQAVGLESDSVAGMIFHLQKSLSGVSELGEDTGSVFAILGLNMQEIRKLPIPQQFERIASSMRGLNTAVAAGAAGKLFGREGAANFLQLARAGNQFTQALKDNAAAAAIMARNAAAFEMIQLSFTKIKNQASNLFAGIAQGAAPGLQSVLDMLSNIDLTGIGVKIGNVVAVLAQSIKEGKLGDVLELSLEAGMIAAANTMRAILEGMEAMFIQVFQNISDHGTSAFKNLQTGLEDAFSGENLKIGGRINAAITGNAADYDLYLQGKKQIDRGRGEVGSGLQTAGKGAGDAFASAFKQAMQSLPNDAKDQLTKLYSQLLANSPAGKGSPEGRLGSDQGFMGMVQHFTGTSLEKMGFRFNGGPTILSDHAAQTARATAETAKNTAVIASALHSNPTAQQGFAALFGSLGLMKFGMP